jgi:glyoxylase-like metal-dependent hydrolase (beta-lactamase superfamily II)
MPAKVVEVHPGIFEIFLPLPMRPTIVNVYLIDCHGAWALIDTGMNSRESLGALEDGFREIGIRIEDLTILIGTHYHVDHFGASAEIRRRSNAKTYLNELDLERVNRLLTLGPATSRPESRAFFLRHGFPIDRYTPEGLRPMWVGTDLYAPLTAPDAFIDDGDVIPVGDRHLEVIWTPGHSPGHSVIYLRKERILIVGDHLLPKITPHVGIYPTGPTNPLRDFIASQRKIQNFSVDLVLPAHGGVYHDHRHRANQLIEHHRYRETEILDLIKRKPQVAFEIAEQIFGEEERPIFHVMAATFETLAHLEYAHSEGRARRSDVDGRTFYRAF